MQLEFSTLIEAPVEKVFDFHMDTSNLDRILPPWIDIEAVEVPPSLRPGAVIGFRVRRFGVTLPWSIKINRVDRPTLFSAEVIHSPLHNFAHAHYFKAIDETTTRITEVIHFPLPFRPFSLIFWPFIKRDMERIFEYRHRVIREILSKKV